MRSSTVRRAGAGAGLAVGVLAAGAYGVQALRYQHSVGRRLDATDIPQPGSPEFARLLEALTSAAPRSGNRVKVMRNGQTLEEMQKAISSATSTIDFSSYIYWPGETAVWTGDAQDREHWRETHLRLEGPVVLDVYGAFVENWIEATDEIPGEAHLPDPHPGFDDGLDVQVTRGTPTGGPSGTAQLFYAAVSGARRRLWMTTAYFAPDPAFEDVLCAAAGRGVDVRILVNGQRVDKEVVRQAGQRSYATLAEAGIRIFEYDRTMLHAKVLLADDGWANIGSSNFDSRSFDHDLEVNVSVSDAGVVTELERQFLDDLESSSPFDLDLWRTRPLHKRAFEAVAGLTRQSL